MSDNALPRVKGAIAGAAPLEVRVQWDSAANVWWAQSDDLPGLAIEAPCRQHLIDHIRLLTPIIVRDKFGAEPGGISVHVTGEGADETLRING